MKTNLYKISWLIITLVFIVGTGISIYLFSLRISVAKPKTKKIPEYQESILPGKVIKNHLPNLPQEEYNETEHADLEIPETDQSLYSKNAPISGGAIKAPEGPAVPPKEEDILTLLVKKDGIEPTEISVNKSQAVILQVSNQKEDIIFNVGGLGIKEIVKAGGRLTFSFRAPDKETKLRYWAEDYITGQIVGEGMLIID